jgi:GAF domain-containing protein
LSVPLVWRGAVVGSINLYSNEPNAFTDASVDEVAPIAGYAAEVIGSSPLYAASLELIEGLVADVDDADDIQLAIGLLMGLGAETEAVALAILRERARKTGASMAETARQIVAGSSA